MHEMLPLAAGVMLAAWMLRWGPTDTRSRAIVGAIYAIVVGFIAASVSGEMAESWAFVLLDAAATIVAFAVSAWVLKQAGWGRQERKA
jgi:hypothetical protein